MAQQTHKLLINAADWPFSYYRAARSAIQNQDIGPRLPGFFAGDQANFDFGQPQLLFCDNVLPVANGLASPWISPLSSQPAGAPVTDFDYAFIIPRDATGAGGVASVGLYGVYVTGKGKNYVYQQSTGKFLSKPTGGITTLSPPTHAEVEGRTFICYPKQAILEWDYVLGTFTAAAIIYPPGVVLADILGIGSAGNYLLLFTEQSILWCSPLNLLDFADIDQGAGSQIPSDIQGVIQCAHPISGGALVYATKSVIGMRFTNNAAAPFVFKGVPGAVGAVSASYVAADAAASDHYIYGKGNLQRVGLTGVENMFPELGEWLTSSNVIEVWNSTTKRVELGTVNPFGVQLRIHNQRFLTISVGAGATGPSGSQPYKLALVYDTVHKRWGKFTLDHVAIVAIQNSAMTYGFWVVKADGSSVLYYPSVLPQASFTPVNSVFLFGHIQEQHDRFVTFHELVVDATETYNNLPVPVVTLIGSQSGAKRDTNTTMDLASSDGMSRTYHSRATAQNFDVAIEGVLTINTILAKVTKHGHR